MSTPLHEVHVAPSILSADFSRLGEQIGSVISAGARVIHVDVMDGHFVPNITVGPLVVEAVAAIVHGAGALVDVHLMIERPELSIDVFAASGADVLTVHQETCPHLHRTCAQIREAGAAAGVAINPATPVETLSEISSHCDLVLVMSVDPGFGGQSFIESSVDKLRRARLLLPEEVGLEVDGGVSPLNAGRLVEAGANLLVAGSSIFAGPDPEARFAELAGAAGEAR